jgi:hypothetical protein
MLLHSLDLYCKSVITSSARFHPHSARLLDLNDKLRKSYVKLTAGEMNDKQLISFPTNTLSKSANKLMKCTSKQHKYARFNLL